MAAQPNDPDVERLVLENNLLSADELSQFKARAAGQGLYSALVNEGVIPYDLQVQFEQSVQGQGAPQPNPLTGTAGGTLRRRLAQGFEQPGGAAPAAAAPAPTLGVPPPRLGAVPPPKLGAPPPGIVGQAPPATSALLGKPPALAGIAAPPAAARPVVPTPALGAAPLVPPPQGLKPATGPMVPPPKVGGGIPPPKLPGGPLVPAPRFAMTPPGAAKPAVPAAAVPAAAAPPAAPAAHAPAHAPAPAPAQAHAPAPEPPKHHDDHGHGGAAAEPKIPEGWPNGIAPVDNTPGGIQDMLKRARAMGASDLHMSVDLPPMVRIHGDLQLLEAGAKPMTPADTQRLIRMALSPAQWAFFDRGGDLDFSYAFPGGGRYRANVMRERNGDGFICRIILDRLLPPEELGLPAHSRRLTEFAQGLVLVTGPSGHGKTTTMMSLVELVNANRPDHIITVEEPIECIMEGKKCHVSQREVGPHTLSFANALKAALRENPDIIVIGELRDYETTSMAINAAETGHLVFASLPTQDAAKTIDKVLDYFPPEEQTQIRLMVSESLRGIISQQLIKRKDGSGRVAAVELLFNSVAVANIIRDANTAGLINAMQLGKNAGMVLMDDSLMDLVNKGVINGEDAYYRSTNKVKFKQWEPKADAAPAKPAAPGAPAPAARPGLPGRR